jgi:hypothetical protein
MASNLFLTRQIEGAGATALGLVGAEPTPELVALVEQLAVGEAVMRDEHGRLGVLRIAPPSDPRVARSFDTRPSAGATERGFDFEDHRPRNPPGRVIEGPWPPNRRASGSDLFERLEADIRQLESRCSEPATTSPSASQPGP